MSQFPCLALPRYSEHYTVPALKGLTFGGGVPKSTKKINNVLWLRRKPVPGAPRQERLLRLVSWRTQKGPVTGARGQLPAQSRDSDTPFSGS